MPSPSSNPVPEAAERAAFAAEKEVYDSGDGSADSEKLIPAILQAAYPHLVADIRERLLGKVEQARQWKMSEKERIGPALSESEAVEGIHVISLDDFNRVLDATFDAPPDTPEPEKSEHLVSAPCVDGRHSYCPYWVCGARCTCTCHTWI